MAGLRRGARADRGRRRTGRLVLRPRVRVRDDHGHRPAAAEAARLDAIIEANEEAQTVAGHWGVPLFVFEGEPFFGQDRVDHLVWRMKKQGLKER